jgi:hypothetical protein
LEVRNNDRLESIALTALTLLDGGVIDINHNDVLASVSIPLLSDMANSMDSSSELHITSNALLASIVLTALATLGDDSELEIYENAALTALDLSTLGAIGDGTGITVASHPALVTPLLGAFTLTNNHSLDFSANALDQATVDFILHRCALSTSFDTGSVDLSGGTNSAPSSVAPGSDYDTLAGRGVSVSVNP